MTAAMNPERILRELQAQWIEMGHEEAESGGVLKACAMTLAVMAEGPEEGRPAQATETDRRPGNPGQRPRPVRPRRGVRLSRSFRRRRM